MRVATLWIHLYSREYWVIYRGPGFLALALFGSFPTPSPSAVSKIVYLSQSSWDWGYDGEKAWSSINHSILSTVLVQWWKNLIWQQLSAQMLSVSIYTCAILYPNKEIARLWQLSQSPHINYHIVNVYILGQHVQYTAKYALLRHFLTRYVQ